MKRKRSNPFRNVETTMCTTSIVVVVLTMVAFGTNCNSNRLHPCSNDGKSLGIIVHAALYSSTSSSTVTRTKQKLAIRSNTILQQQQQQKYYRYHACLVNDDSCAGPGNGDFINRNADDRNQYGNNNDIPQNDPFNNKKGTKYMYFETSLIMIQQIRRELKDCMKQEIANSAYNPNTILQNINKMYQAYQTVTQHVSSGERVQLSLAIDDTIQEFLLSSFAIATKSNSDYHHDHRHLIGIHILDKHLLSPSKNYPTKYKLATPNYNTVPRRVLTTAINALTTTIIQSKTSDATTKTPNIDQRNFTAAAVSDSDFENDSLLSNNLQYSLVALQAYRILQRLISGVGVRDNFRNRRSSSDGGHHKKTPLLANEKDFNLVLHAYCKLGYMETAERIVQLQQQVLYNGKAPASLVAYSILLKGYGNKMDIVNAENVIRRTKAHYAQLDAVMINTMLDAYINCGAVETAETLFNEMKGNDDNLILNRRTYNTIMKGYAKQGALEKATILAEEIKQLKFWDSITTNTLVHAAINAGNLSYAEDILERETISLDHINKKKICYRQQHPNVEAYTELLDTYAKRNQLDRSLSVLQTMQRRNVEPNVVTYTCLMGGLGRHHRIDLANKIFEYMISKELRPTTKMYNALISGLLDETTVAVEEDIDRRVNESIKVIREMKNTTTIPDSVTVSIIVEALGRCPSPRVEEAQRLVDEFIHAKYISAHDNKVWTSMTRLHGRVKNMHGVMKSFQQIERPDTVAVNAYMDACSRCGNENAAINAFDYYFLNKNQKSSFTLLPDVVTYATLIGTVLQRNDIDQKSIRYVRALYIDMKTRFNICADNGLVDVILKSMIRIGSSRQLTKDHVIFISEVMKDAALMQWDDGQLSRRKRAIGTVISDFFSGTLSPNDPIFNIIRPDFFNDELFRRKGWNQVNSGFQLLGGIKANELSTKQQDDFLKSHGWNDVDSAFRLF